MGVWETSQTDAVQSQCAFSRFALNKHMQAAAADGSQRVVMNFFTKQKKEAAMICVFDTFLKKRGKKYLNSTSVVKVCWEVET